MNKLTKGIGYTAVGLACTFGTLPAQAHHHCGGWEAFGIGAAVGAVVSWFCPRYVVARPVVYPAYTTYYQPVTPAPVLPQQPKTPTLPELQPGDTATLQKDGSWLIVRQAVVSTNALTTATQKVRTN